MSTVLLHCCCAPCSLSCIDPLRAERIEPVAFWYNPNIHPWKEYQARRDALCGGLRSIGWEVPDSQGSMFVWAPLPVGYANSVEFCFELLDRTGLLCTPGSAFGTLGEGYVRFALVRPVSAMNEIVAAVKSSGILGGGQ